MAASNVTDATGNDGWETLVEPYADTYSFDTEGDTLTGVYVKTRQVEQEGLDGEPRTVNVYEIEDESGKRWSVWGNYNLDAAFPGIKTGALVRIIFHGKSDIGNGRSVNKFTVQAKS